MTKTVLDDRGLVRVEGEEARSFLDRIVTCDLDRVSYGTARYGGLLSPQGKILADFIIIQADGTGTAFWLDCPAVATADLVRRLTLYKLRAKVTVADRSSDLAVTAGWNEPAPEDAVIDPRLPALGWRAVEPRSDATEIAGAYDAHRIALGVPAATRDFALGDAFPHEALMDQLGGVDFDKGCYIGQEVVSRMQHRGTARTRVVALRFSGSPAAPGSDIVAGERQIGTLGSVADKQGLATIRLDRAADGLEAGQALMAGQVSLTLAKPDWVRFAYPGEALAPAA